MWLFLVCFWFKAIVVATLMKTMIQQQYYCHAFKSILHWPSLLRSTSIWEREREREREITTTCWLLFFLVEKEKNIEESWSTVQSCQLMSCRSAACATWEPTCSLSQQQLIVEKKNHEHKDLLSTVMTKRQERCHATAINSTHHSWRGQFLLLFSNDDPSSDEGFNKLQMFTPVTFY